MHCINQKSSAENQTELCHFPLFGNLYSLLVRAVTSPMGGTIKCSSFLGMEDGREYPIATIACRELTCYKLETSPKAMDWLYLLFIIVLVALTTVMMMMMIMVMMMRSMMMKQKVSEDVKVSLTQHILVPCVSANAAFCPRIQQKWLHVTSIAVCFCPTDTTVVPALGLLL